MNKRELLLEPAVASLVALGLTATLALAAKFGRVSCAGGVKAGKNDCGTSQLSCSGTATCDSDAEAKALLAHQLI